ncbi:Mu phage protease GpI [Geomonas limicola]|uniref:Mu phage protease GpI n=1 Tax=Geomonas limicola TaxID=2740186 RepID=A0A6V8N5P7_9BACT|nr:phage protease [Geomonas limicola]GFO67888.1 Mu phage protease GpI [Geomonas limicola]
MKILVVDDEQSLGIRLALALCGEQVGERSSLNFELQPADGGGAPEWIELIPAGQIITGRDGRTWINDRPDMILASFATEGKDLPIDWEHASEIKAPCGDEAPAAGWIKEMEIRDGAIWGRVEWTVKGAASITSREYRYISPVFRFEIDSRRIFRLTSCGLTNQPNLFLSALNNEEPTLEVAMNAEQMKELCRICGIPEDSTAAQIIAACKKCCAMNHEQPSLDKFVPRADYDTALNRATTAESDLQAIKAGQLETAINTEIDAALAAGKITPATKDYHVAQCKQEGGLDRFKTFVAAAPVIAGATDLDSKEVDSKQTALNAEQQKIADMFGNSAEDLKKYGA